MNTAVGKWHPESHLLLPLRTNEMTIIKKGQIIKAVPDNKGCGGY